MVVFATLLFGNEQINYLFVLLQSIINVYQDDACIIVYFAGVDKKYIEEIRRKAPFVILKENKDLNYGDKDLTCRASHKTAGWCKIIEEQRWPEHLALVDVDTLVVKRIDKYFECKADIIYTYKTNENENLKWPINSGVVLAKNNQSSRLFFELWKNATFAILKGNENTRLRYRHNWGGEDQAAMGFFIDDDRETFSDIKVCNNIIFQGVPCEELNETRCVPITDKTHIVHYKGKWRPVLTGKGWDPKWRPQNKCQVMFDLWNETLKRWKENA